MSHWTHDNQNKIKFTVKQSKYDLFERPEIYLLNQNEWSKFEASGRGKLIDVILF
jgi:hypothetical protein